MNYLDRFHRNLERRWKGSLISVAEAKAIEPNAKKYLSQLAGTNQVDRVTWGWYWLPDEYKDFFDFLAKDHHFKVLQKQSAAALWNGDFIHRDGFTVAVRNSSYARALKTFAKSQGWNVEVETRDFEKNQYRRMRGLPVEELEDTIVDCVKEWAFADAFASVRQNKDAVDWVRISRHYGERIPQSNIRVGQVLKYGTAMMRSRSEDLEQGAHLTGISDDFVRRQVEEAAEQVTELA